VPAGTGLQCYTLIALQGNVQSNPTKQACVTAQSGQTAAGAPGPIKPGGQSSSGGSNQAAGAGAGAGAGGGAGGSSGGGSSPSGGSFVPKDWAAVLDEGNAPSTIAQDLQNDKNLITDRTVVVIDSSQMKNLVNQNGQPANTGNLQGFLYVVVGGGFATKGDATNWCTQAVPDPTKCLGAIGSDIAFDKWPMANLNPSPTPTSPATP
jgi:hypothetical protein